MNKILDDTGRITESVAKPIEEASDFIVGLKKGFNFIGTISDFVNRLKGREKKEASKKEPSKKENPAPKKALATKPKSKTKGRRFFTKSGKSLGK
jgi:hypothetical protein